MFVRVHALSCCVGFFILQWSAFSWFLNLPCPRPQTIPEFLLLVAFNTLIGSNSAMATRTEPPTTLSGGPILGGGQSPHMPLMGGERSPPGIYVGP
jgi:hypothetical protein